MDQSQKEIMKRNILSYVPGVRIQEVKEYMPSVIHTRRQFTKVIELQLARKFAHPLEKLNTLNQHDPVAYIIGMMTQLKP